MKKLMTAALCLFLSGTAAQAGPLKVRLGLGATAPLGATADSLKTGFNGLLGVELGLGTAFALQGDLTYHSLSSKVPGADSFQVYSALASLKYNLSAPLIPVKPYLLAGLGLASAKVSTADTAAEAETESKMEYALGAGVGVGSLFFEARYLILATDVQSTKLLPLTVGVNF